jgi:predicted DNA-binding transcriptional regulator YafY
LPIPSTGLTPIPEFINWVLYYGSRVEMLKPDDLRERVVAEQKKVLEVYMGS